MSVYFIFNNIPSASGGFAPRLPPGLRPWTLLGDLCPPHALVSPDPLVSPDFHKVAPLAKIPAGAHGGPTFFSEQGPVLSKSDPGLSMLPVLQLTAHLYHSTYTMKSQTFQ